MYNPLEQFTIHKLLRNYNKYYDITITNSTIFLIISIIIGIFLLYNTNRKYIPNKYITLSLNIFKLIRDIVKDILNNTIYLPFIFSLFIFLLFNNTLGLFPYAFTTTSHIVINFSFSFSIILGVTILGLYLHKFKFFKLFIPGGDIPKAVLPLIIIIEIISYLSRIISLSVRLTANMLSGHILLALISSFGFLLPPILYFIPLAILIPFFILEIAISLIQSYVFVLLTTSYIKDSLFLH